MTANVLPLASLWHGRDARVTGVVLAADVQPVSFNWAFQPWLVILTVLVAGVLMVYLYRAQQRIASRRLVLTLTGIRLLLLAMLFVMLAGPVIQWRRDRD